MPDAKQNTSASIRWLRDVLAIGGLLAVLLACYIAAFNARFDILATALAVVILLAAPSVLAMLAFCRLPAARSAAGVWAMALNSAALIVICFVLRQTTGIGRTSLLAAWEVWTLVLLLIAWRPEESSVRMAAWLREYGLTAAIGLVVCLIGMFVMRPEQFQQCFNEDGNETYELASSLHDHFLPYRELETWDPIPGGRMGTVVVNPSLINSYWSLGLLTLIGDRETATRLPFWIWSFGGYLVAVHLARSRGGQAWAALPLAGLMFLTAVNFTFYVGYDRYMSDIGNPGVTDALFTMFLLMSYDSLARAARGAWVASIAMATLVLYAGPVMFVLSVAAMLWWKPIPRRQTLAWAATAAALLLAVAAFYAIWGWHDGSLPYWIDTLDQEYVNHYLANVPRWMSASLFFGYFVLGAGGIAALGIFAALRRDAWQRTVATITLLYLAIVLGSGFKNLHWLAPLWPIPLILFLRGGGKETSDRPERLRSLLAVASIVVCIVFSWPHSRATFTLNRELGEQTTILTDQYLSAATWARIRLVLHGDRQMGWTCDAWTWVTYSDMRLQPGKLRPLVLTDGDAPSAAYWLLASRPVEGTATVARLYCCSKKVEEWLRTASSPAAIDRYPWVYRPLASGMFSPHDNKIDDVQRLGW